MDDNLEGVVMQVPLIVATEYSVGIVFAAVCIVASIFGMAHYVPRVLSSRRLVKRLKEAKDRERKIAEYKAYLYENDPVYRREQNEFELMRRAQRLVRRA